MQKNQKVIDKFKPIVKKSFNAFISELMNHKISSALKSEERAEEMPEALEELKTDKVVTTQEEIEAFFIVRSILAEIVSVKDVIQKDTESYFGVLYKGNIRKPICRINFDTKKKQILIPDESKSFTRYYLEDASDIYTYKDQLIEVLKRYIQ